MATDLTIKSLMTELNTLKTETKTRKRELKKLTDREKQIKDQISNFLKEQKQPGVKDKSQGIAIIVEKVEKITRKKKNQSNEDALNVLLHYMDDGKASKIYNEIKNAQNEQVKKDVLKIVKI